MPLQDLLGEVQTLSQLQHQRFADALTAQVQQSNMDIAHASILQALPTESARTAFNNHDWKGLESAGALPTSVDTLRAIATSDYIAKNGVTPSAMAEGVSRLMSGMNQGDVAKSGLEAQTINDSQKYFTGEGGDMLHQAFLHSVLGVGSPAQLAIDHQIATNPAMVAKAASVQAGTGVSATTQLGSQTALATNNATVGANIYGTQAQERIAMANQGLEMAKMSLMKAQLKGSGSDKAAEYLSNMEKAVTALNTGGLDPVGQVANTQIYNANVQRMIDEGLFSADAANFANPDGSGGGMMLRSGSTGMSGAFSREVQKVVTGHKP